MPLHRLKHHVSKLLNCADDIGAVKINVDELYSIFCQFTQVNIQNQNESDIFLPTGKAISPAQAAHCLLVIAAKFLRGIIHAINDKLKTVEKVNFFYAGCGSYATLITPLLTQFSYNQIAVDLLDINEYYLRSAQIKLINATRMEGETLHFWYEQDDVPYICCCSMSTSKLFQSIGRSEYKNMLDITDNPFQ